jgi:hypothetical protein
MRNDHRREGEPTVRAKTATFGRRAKQLQAKRRIGRNRRGLARPRRSPPVPGCNNIEVVPSVELIEQRQADCIWGDEGPFNDCFFWRSSRD